MVCPHQPSHHSRPQVVCTEYNVVCSEGLPVSFGRFLMSTYVLPSAAFGLEFAGETPSSLSVFDRSLRRWCRHLLRWPAGTPNASVLSELALFDSLRMAHGQALSLYGRLTTLDSGTCSPLPAVVFRFAASVPGTWAHWCRSLLVSHSCWVPELSGVGPGSNPGAVRRWFARGVALALDRAWSHRLIGGFSALHSVRFDVSSSCFSLNRATYGLGINPADARWWGLARHGHDPCPGGRTSRHREDPLGCRFCGSSLGTLAHCMGSCPAFVDLQLEWCAAAGVHMRDIVQWSSHEWVFDPLHSLNNPLTIRAHVTFVPRVCARVDDAVRH